MKVFTRITIVGIILSSILAFLGTFFGSLWLGIISGLPLFTPIVKFHPDLQLGFLNLFILSVSYLLLPRFKNKALDKKLLAYISLFLVFSGNIINFFNSFTAFLLIFIGNTIATYILLKILGKPSGPLALAEPFMILSLVSLPLSSLLRIYTYPYHDFLQFFLFGFPSSMIFGVMVRTVHFRIAKLRRNLIKLSFLLFLLAHLLSFFKFYSEFFFFSASLIFLLGLDAFKIVTKGPILDKMKEVDKVRYLYFSKVFIIASIWLILGNIFLLLNNYHPFLRDAFIHSITVGFIGNTIMAYAPILLPPLLEGKITYKPINLKPIYLVNIGNLWRIIGLNLQISFTFLSSLPIFLGMVLFLKMIHSPSLNLKPKSTQLAS